MESEGLITYGKARRVNATRKCIVSLKKSRVNREGKAVGRAKETVLCSVKVNSSNQLLADPRFADCSFLVGQSTDQQLISAHKCVLATASPVFEAMLYGPACEHHFPIHITDISPAGFRAMIQHLYRSVVPIYTVDDLCQLWVASNKYQLEELGNNCAELLCPLLSAENVCTALDYAIAFENMKVEQTCVHVIAQHSVEVLCSETFVEVTPQVLNKILSLNNLRADEIIIFEAVERWARTRCGVEGLEINTENLRKVCRGAVEKIRFLIMTPQQFTKGPAMSEILTKDESYGILMSLPDVRNAGSLVPYPNLSKEWRQRSLPFYARHNAKWSKSLDYERIDQYCSEESDSDIDIE